MSAVCAGGGASDLGMRYVTPRGYGVPVAPHGPGLSQSGPIRDTTWPGAPPGRRLPDLTPRSWLVTQVGFRNGASGGGFGRSPRRSAARAVDGKATGPSRAPGP